MSSTKFPFFRVVGVEQELVDYGETIASLSKRDQLSVVRVFLNAIIDAHSQLDDLLDLVARAALRERYSGIQQHIGQLLQDNYALTPSKAAYIVRRRLGMPAKMRPLTIALARREKNRMRAESRRALEKGRK
jgi:hypothetical protein